MMTPARKVEIEMNHKERKQRKEELEGVYQDMAYLIKKNSYFYTVSDEAYPDLIMENEETGKKYQIIIKEVK